MLLPKISVNKMRFKKRKKTSLIRTAPHLNNQKHYFIHTQTTNTHYNTQSITLTRWLAVQIPPLPDNLTFPPFEIQWKRGRWCPLDLPGWSTYTRHSCPDLRHVHLCQCRGIPRSGNQSWKWAHWNPSRFRHMCPPLPVTKEQSRQEGREQIHSFWVI